MGLPLDHTGTHERIWAYGYGDMSICVPLGRVGLMPPRQKREVPAWAAALKTRRFELGKSQEVVALDSGVLNQTTVSELEGGKYELQNLTAARIAGLARGLDWTLAELEAETGVDLGLSGYASKLDLAPSTSAKTRRRPLPESLEQMIEEKQGLAPELATERWQQYLAGQRFSTGEATPERWWKLFLLLQSAGVEPGGN